MGIESRSAATQAFALAQGLHLLRIFQTPIFTEGSDFEYIF